MKKLIAVAIFISASSSAFAQPGCGVGAMIWKGQSGIVPHVLAGTTNVTASQTISMTFGIAGCHTNQSVQSMALLIDSRGAEIAAEISRGQGENLEAMAVALGVKAEDRDEFYNTLTSNFNAIFPNADTTSGEVVNTIVALLEKSESLRKYVMV